MRTPSLRRAPLFALALALAACKLDHAAPAPAPSASDSAGDLFGPRAEASDAASAFKDTGLYLGASAKHACFVDDAGKMRCWGSNDRGQMDGFPSPRPQPHPRTAMQDSRP